MLYRLTIIGSGGEFSMGLVPNEDEINLIKAKILDETLSLYNDDSDDSILTRTEVDFYNYTSVLYVHGPDVNTVDFVLNKINDDGSETEILDTYVNDCVIDNYNQISVSNPYLNENNSNGFVFGGWTFSKGIVHDYVIETVNEFDFSNLYLCTTNLDETFEDTEIVSSVLYLESDYKIDQDLIMDKFNTLSHLELESEFVDEGGIRSSGVVVYDNGKLIYSS